MINRILPIKVISRQLLNLQLSQKGGNSIMTTNDSSSLVIIFQLPPFFKS